MKRDARMRPVLSGGNMRLLKVLAVVLMLSLASFAADSPFSGSWKLNLAKSKLTPPVPKSDVAVVNVDENGVKLSEDIVTDKGESLKVSYDAKFDGKNYPVTGDPSTDSVSYQRVNATTLKGKTKKDGKVAMDATIVVSKDGKTTTVNYTDYSQPKPAKGTSVYDRQ
jgi:hypothetical protein